MTAGLARALLILVLCAGGARAATAQARSDPTRPPSVVPSSGAQEVEAELPSNQLQSVLLSPSRKVAVINGQSVALGGKYGDAVLAQISENGVVLKYGDRVEELKLLPIEKTRPGAARGKATK
jgi:MSHA biogenesis protein MshK